MAMCSFRLVCVNSGDQGETPEPYTVTYRAPAQASATQYISKLSLTTPCFLELVNTSEIARTFKSGGEVTKTMSEVEGNLKGPIDILLPDHYQRSVTSRFPSQRLRNHLLRHISLTCT